MRSLVRLSDLSLEDVGRSGSKAWALTQLIRNGILVPRGFCITTDAYERFVDTSGLRERIHLELSRKRFDDMRWEELWDASLRIRNMFVRTRFPETLAQTIKKAIKAMFGGRPVSVRSSAPGEDTARTSFAGLHDSFLNVKGMESVFTSVKRVWASLWSDRALLYRRELGHDVERSAMAVIIQEFVVGDASGVTFGQNPQDPETAVVEAVHGLNQGLVDGDVEPDRWVLDRKSGEIISLAPVARQSQVSPIDDGVHLVPIDESKRSRTPLDDGQVAQIFRLVQQVERIFGSPQDMEWTFREDALYALQSRPITTGGRNDKRSWYLSLTRSFENLQALRRRIGQDLLPRMQAEADAMAAQDLMSMDNVQLAAEIERRTETYTRWHDTYWNEFIPFAHGMRLFGQVYNDTMQPEDPFEFMSLISSDDLQSIKRNRELAELAAFFAKANNAVGPERAELERRIDDFIDRYGQEVYGGATSLADRKTLLKVLRQLGAGKRRSRTVTPKDGHRLEQAFLEKCTDGRAAELLALARDSYRMRDDDNIYLGRIESELLRARKEARRRCEQAAETPDKRLSSLLRDGTDVQREKRSSKVEAGHLQIPARQLVGQPAGPGIATGLAHVVERPEHLTDFREGEVLVCDTIDPNMTFIVPLAIAVVERRGGMLIHGAIIAREYGLPCVTGVPNATSQIHTGQQVTVDGYTGIVTITRRV